MVEDGALVLNPSHTGCFKLADTAVAKAARTRFPRVKSDQTEKTTKSEEEKPAKAVAKKPTATKKAPTKKAPGTSPRGLASIEPVWPLVT